ncbi:MAG: ATP-binding protein [Planctomycetota bacterium]
MVALLGISAMVVAVITLWGFVAHSEATYGWGHFARMSLYTTECVTALAVGYTITALRGGDVDGRALASGTVALFAVFGLWQAQVMAERREQLDTCRLRAKEAAAMVQREIADRLGALEAFTQVTAAPEGWGSGHGFDVAAGRLLEEVGIQQLWWLDRESELLWSLPSGTPFALDPSDPRWGTLELAANRGRSAISTVFDGARGERAMFIAAPLKLARVPAAAGSPQTQGVLVGSLNASHLARRERNAQRASGYVLVVENEGSPLAGSAAEEAWEQGWEASESFGVGGRAWTVRLWPSKERLLAVRSLLPEIVLALGIVLSLGSSVLLQVGQRAQRQAELAYAARADAEQARSEAERHRTAAERDAAELARINEKLEVEIQVRTEHEVELRRRREELLRSNADLEQFAYVAAHDLRSPLRAITQLAGWIAEDLGDKLQGEPKENMDLLLARVNRLDMLLDGLLSYSRVGRRAYDLEVVDLQKVVDDLGLVLDVPEGIEVRSARALPTVETVRVPLETVLRNLVGNAIKHHDREHGQVVIDCEELEREYRFVVEDDGPGIPERYREKVFKLFSTLKPRDEVEGSGMGLAIVKKKVERLGGSVRLEDSSLGRGTRFVFTWPKRPQTARLRTLPNPLPAGDLA